MSCRALAAALAGALAVLLSCVSPAAAADRYDVTGVSRDDVLNMRSDVAGLSDLSRTEVIGRIPWDARGVASSGITATVRGALWRKVRYGGTDGWVSARYLAPAKGSDPDARPDALKCGGTEPFWSLSLGGGEAVFETPGADGPVREVDRVLSSTGARNRPRQWAFHLGDEQTATRIAVATRTEQCSDGMSDWTYPFDLVLVDTATGSAPLQGCCSLPLP